MSERLKGFPEGRIAIMDGAMGTMIQNYGLEEKDFRDPLFGEVKTELKGNNECLNFTHPEIIAEIHHEYIDAGADIIETNSFSANRISQKEYGLEAFAYEMARRAASIARKAADEETEKLGRRIFVAGSVGPTSKSLTLAPDITDPGRRDYTFDDLAEAYTEQIDGLVDGGADIIILETNFDALNTKAALYAIEKKHRGFPVIVSVTASDMSGRSLTGQTMEAFYTSIRHYPITAFGINCSLGAHDMIPILMDISSFSEVPVICYPNAGLPNELGQYNEKPEQMAHNVFKMGDKGLIDIIGGCCGTTPAHICACATAVADLKPGKERKRNGILKVSGLEAYSIDVKESNFVNIGERTNVAGSRKFARLISEGNYDAALQIAADQIENGANIIDINMDDAMLDSEKEMQTFVRCIENDPAVSKAALMIDSSHWETIVAGLKNAQGKCIVNSISLKEGPEKFLEKALEIHDLGAAMVVMAFDEEGQATSYERKISICERAYKLLTSNGIPPEDIIFDVNVLSIGTGLAEHADYAVDFIEAVRWIKQNLPGSYTSGGISNLSFSFRGNNPVREAMHSAFLYHAVKAGLDMGIVNPGMLKVYDDVEPELLKCVEDVIFNKDPEATERLIAKAQEIAENAAAVKDGKKPAVEQVPCSLTADERVSEALVKGKANTLEADILECLKVHGTPVKVIEGPLMAGMEKVGELFGAGKMFLPQVVKSAKIMKDAVNVLEPYMKEGEDAYAEKPVIINATVKGDVHDIGKNITGIVLSCNGFNVIDLGVMVDKETILDEAVKHNAAIIGVSGLITPSLFQMEEICREMKARNMDIPLFIGGATTSALHTALKLMPLYDHVFYCQDASTSAVMAKKCMMDREAFEDEQHLALERIAAIHSSTHPANGEQKKCVFSKRSFLKKEEHRLTDAAGELIEMRELTGAIDWDMFLAVWGIKPTKENKQDPEVIKLRESGKKLLRKLNRHKEISVRYSMKFFESNSKDNNLIMYDKDAPKGRYILPMLRQEKPSPNTKGKPMCISMCDYAPDFGLGITAPVGLFALSVKVEHNHPEGCDCEQCSGKDFDSMLLRSVRVCVAEAASKWIDKKVKKMIISGAKKMAKPAIGYACCPDHSLKKEALEMLPGSELLGITLTDSFAMVPDASICGFVIVHPSAGYPEIHHISQKQYDEYAKARGFNEEEARKFLGHLL
ncbi:MAG: methionine synthase [Bacteroidales bacterium]|nr:methionine synthase [Bacteroidales bacterium]